MASITGIEIGGGHGAVVRVAPGPGDIRLSAFRILYQPTDVQEGTEDVTQAVSESLRRARLELRLPRRARAVVWGLPENASSRDAYTRGVLAPVEAAGFDVEAAIRPSQALALLAGTRPAPAEGAAAWLALNETRAAIAIVRGSDLLLGREFAWTVDRTFRPGDRLLQRYLHIAQLAPELRRAAASVLDRTGLPISAIVTCGNLRELRSVAMALIEELDREVETLDSMDGLLAGSLLGDPPGGDMAPQLWLAAITANLEPAARRSGLLPLGRIAAAVAVLAFGWWALATWRASDETASGGQPAPAGPVEPAAARVPPAPAQSDSAAARPGPQTLPAPPARQGARRPDPMATGTMGSSQRGAERDAAPPPQPPPGPLPAVTSVLVSGQRRLAIVNGKVVEAGEAVGQRTVVRIDADGVIFQEPSGRQVRVPIRRAARR